MTQFFKTLAFVALNLTLLVLAGCGIAQQPNVQYGDLPITTMNYFPNVTTTTVPYVNTSLSCSISTNVTAVVLGNPVVFTVTASGGNTLKSYQFDDLSVDLGVSQRLNPVSTSSTNYKASVSYPYFDIGTRQVQAWVHNDGQTASCSLQVDVQELSVTVSALNKNFVGDLGGIINLTATSSGFDPSKTVHYKATVQEPGVSKPAIRASAGTSSVAIQALDLAAHPNLTVTVYAYTDNQNYISTQFKVAFLPPLNCRYSITGNLTANNNITFKADALDPNTTQVTGENLTLTYWQMQPVADVTVVNSSNPSQTSNQVTLKFAKNGPYTPNFRAYSPLRNQYCNWYNPTSVAVSPDNLLVPLTIN